jgi:hypothetical protein
MFQQKCELSKGHVSQQNFNEFHLSWTNWILMKTKLNDHMHFVDKTLKLCLCAFKFIK